MQLTAAKFTRVSINGSQLTNVFLYIYVVIIIIIFLNIGFSVLRRGGEGGGGFNLVGCDEVLAGGCG